MLATELALLGAFLAGLALTTLALAGTAWTPPLTAAGGSLRALFAMPGNRFLATLYPLFFFLLRRPPAYLATTASGGLAAVLLGALLITPFGMPVEGSNAQSHVRGWPLRLLPLELAWLPSLPDFRGLPVAGGTLWARRDESELRGDSVAVLGSITSELWLETHRPLAESHWLLLERATQNRVALRFGRAEWLRDDPRIPPGGLLKRVDLIPGPPAQSMLGNHGQRRFFYPLRVQTLHGERRLWRSKEKDDMYIGAELTFLGDDAYLGQDVYALAWLGCGAPQRVTAGEELMALARVRNQSPLAWPVVGAARVRLAARWRRGDASEVPGTAQRADFLHPLEPQQSVARWIRVQAPQAPGHYRLEIEPVFENVAWFSDRGVAPCRMEIDVEAAPPP